MKESVFTTVCTTQNGNEAERLLGMLRNAGLHPVDLPASAPLAGPNVRQTFPIQVPPEEEDAARQVLRLPYEEAA
jgi:hypothetical protein